MSQPRHKRKRSLAEHDGERVRITRADGHEGYGVMRCEFDVHGQLGRVFIERLKLAYAFAHLGNYTLFKAAIDIQIEGFPGWWMISNFPVEISRHTSEEHRGRCYTRMVMDMMGYRGDE